MAKDQTLTLTLKVDDHGTATLDSFKKKIGDTAESVQGMGRALQILKWDAVVRLTTEVYNLASRVYDSAKAIAEHTMEIDKNARMLNMGVETYQKWAYAAKMADVSQEDLMGAIKIFTRNLAEAQAGTNDASKALTAMGIPLRDSHGKLKDQQTILAEVIEHFSRYESGMAKDTLAVALFGRQWMTVKPLLESGMAALRGYGTEAERLGVIHEKDLVEKGKLAEDQFKRINAQLEAGKLRLAPYALGFANLIEGMVEKMNSLKTWVASNPSIWGFITGALVPTPILMGLGMARAAGAVAPESVKPGYGEWELPENYGQKPPPGIAHKPTWESVFGKYYENQEAQRDYLKSLEEKAKVEERMGMAEAIGETWTLEVGLIEKRLELTKEILEADKKRNEEQAQIERGMRTENDALLDNMDDYEKLYGLTRAEFNERMALSKLMHEAWKEDHLKTTELEKAWQSFGESLGSVWATNVTGMLKGTQTVRDGFINMAKGMGDAFISAIMKMTTQWLLFKALGIGKWGDEGGSFGTSWLGGLFKSIFGAGGGGGGSAYYGDLVTAYAGGGIANQPQLAMVGEGGPEAMVPLKNGRIPIEGGGGSIHIGTYIAHVSADDPDAWERKRRTAIVGIVQQAQNLGDIR